MRPEFDNYAKNYDAMHTANIRASGEAPGYFAAYKIKELRRLSTHWGISTPRILDFGSGIGNSIPHYRAFFPESEIQTADVSSESLALAVELHGERERQVIIGIDDNIPIDDDTFDIAFAACVFHHIEHEKHDACLRELKRVVRPGGRIVIFEHNPINPLTRRAVRDCPFDVDAHLVGARVLRDRMALAGWNKPQIDYHVFFPAMLARLRVLEPKLRWCPFGAQYACHAISPANDAK